MHRMTLAAERHFSCRPSGHRRCAALARFSDRQRAGYAVLWDASHLGLEIKTKISTETVIGVVFTVALAIGSFLTSGEELIDARSSVHPAS